MNISLTSDDVIAVATVGSVVVTPIVAYIRFVHGQQSAMWKALDKMREAQATFVIKDEQEKHRLELKADLEKYRLELKQDLLALEGRIIKEVDRLVEGKKPQKEA